MGYEVNNTSQEKEVNKMGKVELLKEVDPDDVNGILEVQNNCLTENFNDDIRLDKEDIEELIKDGDCFVVVLKENEKIIGFILGEPHGKALKELSKFDPEMKNDGEQKIYVIAISVLPEYKGGKLSLMLMRKIIIEAKAKNFSNFSMHIRKDTGFSGMVQKVFEKSQLLRTINNWMGTGEKFDYLEIEIIEKDIHNLNSILTSKK